MAERIELAKLCSSKDWSKAIRVLDSLLSQSCAIQDLCNRAFCYSQLELHKHVIKDCDKALKLDPSLIQAYILKGRAFSALGRKEEALSVWELGYKHSSSQSADLKQLLELEDLLKFAKEKNYAYSNHEIESDGIPFPSLRPSLYMESSEKSEKCIKPNGNIESLAKSSDHLGMVHKIMSRTSPYVNGTQFLCSQSSENHGDFGLRDSAESCIASPAHYAEPIDFSNTSNSSVNLSNIPYKLIEEAEKSRKFCVARISENKSINVDFRLSRGISQVNDGNYNHAVSIFGKILEEDPDYPEALIGRGTAYAFLRELHAAIADFTKAIRSNPLSGEAWKRRGQAQAALGESAEAIADLTKALDFEPNSADILHERGIVNFKFKDYEAAVRDLTACIFVDPKNKSAYTYMGLALSSLGDYEKAREAHLKAIQIDQHFLEAWTHLAQFYQDMAKPDKALDCLHETLQIDGRFAKAYHLRGLLLHGMGEHRNAIKELSAGLSIESSSIECLYLRASCYHAIGEFREAIKDYDAALDIELDSMEKFVLQCLAFYQSLSDPKNNGLPEFFFRFYHLWHFTHCSRCRPAVRRDVPAAHHHQPQAYRPELCSLGSIGKIVPSGQTEIWISDRRHPLSGAHQCTVSRMGGGQFHDHRLAYQFHGTNNWEILHVLPDGF